LLRILATGSAVDSILRSSARGRRGIRPSTIATIGVSTIVYLECRRRSVLAFRRAGLGVSRGAMLAGLDAVLCADMASIEQWLAASGPTRLVNDVGDLERGFDGAGEIVLLAANTAVLATAFLVLAPRFSWILALVGGTMAVALLAGAAAHENRGGQDPRSMAHRRLFEVFDALPTVRSYGAESRMTRRVEDALNDVIRSESQRAVVDERYPYRLEGIAMVGAAVTIIGAATALGAGAISPGRHLVLMMIAGHMFYPFAYMTIPIANARRGWAARQRLAELADMPAESESPSVVAVPAEAPKLVYDDVSFTYPGSDAAAVTAVSFEIPRRSFAAIVGASGSGKSTLTRLLLRFYDPDGGVIALDDQDIRTFPKRELRRSIAWTDQRAFLFDGTIAYNISIAREAAGEGEIEEAARLAAVDEFVSPVADGLDAEIGANGSRLSDGQRQRVLLARAMLKPSSVVILDEATSALDADTERRVLANIRQRTSDRTLIVIAHHMASIEGADIIVVLEEGSVVATGTHSELSAACPAYRRLLDEAA
jgi:ABC-type multidrug transport system fused ATPase/permease subunit